MLATVARRTSGDNVTTFLMRHPRRQMVLLKSQSVVVNGATPPPVDTETSKIPSRPAMLNKLKSTEEFDVLVIGGGATGAGAALDAQTRGLNVACVEREDFSSGTSSRSTKLIWGGSRYLVQAFIRLFSPALLRFPVTTIKKFLADFNMVLNCHRERKFLLDTQPHLTNWLPIAVPLTRWLIWPAPFNYPPAALGPLGLFPLFFKFYDSLSGFTCPPSHIMTPARARRKFPQLADNNIKYCPVFYEGQHDDARTNLAIAQTAAREGATIANYCEVVELIRDTAAVSVTSKRKVIGAMIRDVVSGETFSVRAKTILFCGGPFTDELRKLEDPKAKEIVNGAGGIHIVLPSYYAPSGIGLVDMSTSDGRFLFFLPWEGHVLVGTTDHKQKASMRPEADETEIAWVLTEAAKYLHPELKVRREDVLSAWSGVRPLVLDPSTSPDANTSSASRDHTIFHNPDSGIVFAAGGKWTTYREMAQDAVDKVIEVGGPALAKKATSPCRTLTIDIVGREGYSSNLPIRLIQEFGIAPDVAVRLAKAYGGRARDILNIEREEQDEDGDGYDRRLAAGYPYIDAEVAYAVRHEWAVTADDILARRTRLAFLNKEAALAAVPKVVALMATELGWDLDRQREETMRCLQYMRHFGGRRAASHLVSDLGNLAEGAVRARMATRDDIMDAFAKVDYKSAGLLDTAGVQLVAEMLGRPLSEEELKDCFTYAEASDEDATGTARVSLSALVSWWNSESTNPELVQAKKKLSVRGSAGVLFG